MKNYEGDVCVCRGRRRHEHMLHPGCSSHYLRCPPHHLVLQTQGNATIYYINREFGFG